MTQRQKNQLKRAFDDYQHALKNMAELDHLQELIGCEEPFRTEALLYIGALTNQLAPGLPVHLVEKEANYN